LYVFDCAFTGQFAAQGWAGLGRHAMAVEHQLKFIFAPANRRCAVAELRIRRR
jgi:hypothetical protein